MGYNIQAWIQDSVAQHQDQDQIKRDIALAPV